MEHVLAKIETHVSPDAMAAGTPVGLKVGHISYAADIVREFTDDTGATPKLMLLMKMAESLTCDQFQDQMKQAQKLASDMDSQFGFVPVEGTKKNSERYGPRRNVLNTQISTARQVFGAYKLVPEAFKEVKSFNAAVSLARQTLDDNNVSWDGTPIPSDQQKEQKKALRDVNKAEDALMERYPQQDGESIKDYKLRLATMLDAEVDNQKATALFKAMVKEHGSPENVLNICRELIRLNAQPVFLDETAQYFWEEAQIIRMGEMMESQD